ncbi:low molecular weight protein-tyrosine-phosphatase [Rhizobium tumorigenes]|uniref:low molecular weight protein-tyrosine-phosphatase n=1 Tax=Rhizobium tumorigenes TaxID=2041385 RepID=UPI00241D9079|nr:low molecular weight protein-tyrosine-phosphatase [Rhizobium tumorigenes]WFS00491.1 low molecular weight phosphotyrosine protein phosphatase [Rhizobium tumorigenes]
MHRFKILFVCMGNICRSPLAEGIFKHMALNAGRAAEFDIASAGTGGWYQGNPPDPRSIAVAAAHGIDIAAQRARRITAADFDRFDLILALDRDNLRVLEKMASGANAAKLHLFNRYALETGEDIPDPYYGNRDDFDRVYSMLLTGCKSLLETAGKVRTS